MTKREAIHILEPLKQAYAEIPSDDAYAHDVGKALTIAIETLNRASKGKIIKVFNPELGSEVYKYDGAAFIPVMILEGCYEANDRLSNFWTWYNLIAKKIENGYGDFWIWCNDEA